MTELEKLRERETEIANNLVNCVNKRDALGAELDALRIKHVKAIGASIATHEQLASCRKAIASLALTDAKRQV